MKKEHKLTAMELQYIQYHIDDCPMKGRCTVCRGIAKLLAVYKAAVERKG
jgi:ferredoxin